MTIKFYESPQPVVCGSTMKDEHAPEHYNMALHSCHSMEAVIANREAFAALIHRKPEDFIFLHQTHSKNVIKVKPNGKDQGFYDPTTAHYDYDALYSNDPQAVLGVFTADCVPLLFYDANTEIIGAIHAGWKSTSLNIVGETLRLIQEEGVNLSKLQVWIGPSIQMSSFEIQKDVILQMQNLPIELHPFVQPKDATHYTMDVVGINVALLHYYGVSNIVMDPLDTYTSEEDCFSYRRNKATERHYHFIYRQ